MRGFEFRHSIPAALKGIMGAFASLHRNRSGNFAIFTAILIIPLLATVGLAMDYSRAVSIRSQLQNAADAAALGALKSPSVLSSSSGEITLASDEAKRLFQANLPYGTDMSYTTPETTIKVTKKDMVATAKVSYKTYVPATMLKVIGRDNIEIDGNAQATADLPPYMDFYMLLDNSPSMGLAATQADMAKMQANTPNNCAFACHETGNPDNYYKLAKKLGVAMRIDVVRDAVQQLTGTADDAQVASGQYRMGIYTFGKKAEKVSLTKVADLSSNMKSVAGKANAIDLMTTPYYGYNGNTDSIFDESMTDIRNIIGAGGTGASPSSRQKVLFFVSDGVAHEFSDNCTENEKQLPDMDKPFCMEPLLTSLCDQIKANGVKIAVLYTTYLPLDGDPVWGNYISKFIDKVPTAMESCASPGLYFEVTKGEDISARLHDLFFRVADNPRLTN